MSSQPHRTVRLWLATMALGLGLSMSAAAARAEPALWVAEQGGAKVYLFGTVHLLKPDMVWRTPKIDAAFDEAQALWLEVKDLDNPQALQGLVAKYGLDAAHPLSTKISDADRALLARDAAALGVPASAFEPLRPWMAALQLTLAPLVKAGYGAGSGVDLALKASADRRGEAVDAFETAEEQLRFFADLPQRDEVEYLHVTLTDYDQALPELEQAASAWIAGDTAALNRLFVDKFRGESPELYDLLLKTRNFDMAAKIKARMARGGVIFVAVGAAHLVGADSLQADLERLGVHVRRL